MAGIWNRWTVPTRGKWYEQFKFVILMIIYVVSIRQGPPNQQNNSNQGYMGGDQQVPPQNFGNMPHRQGQPYNNMPPQQQPPHGYGNGN